jgi:6-phosphofructokinase 1
MGLLVGGGPAPGINAVIAAATIRARLHDVRVVGLLNGFSGLMSPDLAHDDPAVVRELDIHDVSRIHFRGGSSLGTSRANPTKSNADLDRVTSKLQQLGIDKLVTIGGDDTSLSAFRVASHSEGRLRVVHVPKTIDNDLCLPPSVDTFGYQTARSVGVQIVQNLMVDAKTCGRWYIVVAMGRKAGHLALGIGKAAGATLTIIPEEFSQPELGLSSLTDSIVGSIIKRAADGRADGIAVVAEGAALRLDASIFEQPAGAERDEHGHVRLSEVNLGEVLKVAVRKRLAEYNIETTIVSKDIGYELRCADPIPFDMEYCRDLGYCASRFLLEGGSDVLISMQGGTFVPVPLAELLDKETGRMNVRMVDVASTRYAIARRYMIRLRREDFDDEQRLAPLARAAGVSPEVFREKFSYVVQSDRSPLVLR